MAFAADDQVIVDRYSERSPGLGDALGQLDVGAARLGIAAWVIVHQGDCGCPQIHRTANNLSGLDRRLIDQSFTGHFFANKHILLLR